MPFLDMFDKLDDIIYEPVKTICAWVSEPLNYLEHKRNSETIAQEAQIESAKRMQEAAIEMCTKERMVELETNKKRWDADIDDLTSRREIERNKRVLDAIIEYRRSMIEDAKSIADSLSHMEMSLVEEAHALVLKKAEEYEQLQHKAMEECDKQLEEINARFANNERVRIRREDMVLDATADIIDAAKEFIAELKDDIKRINSNNTNRVNIATAAADKIMEKMGATLAIESQAPIVPIEAKTTTE